MLLINTYIGKRSRLLDSSKVYLNEKNLTNNNLSAHSLDEQHRHYSK